MMYEKRLVDSGGVRRFSYIMSGFAAGHQRLGVVGGGGSRGIRAGSHGSGGRGLGGSGSLTGPLGGVGIRLLTSATQRRILPEVDRFCNALGPERQRDLPALPRRGVGGVQDFLHHATRLAI